MELLGAYGNHLAAASTGAPHKLVPRPSFSAISFRVDLCASLELFFRTSEALYWG